MTKPENGSSDAWDCEADYEEEGSPWILFADRRPEDGQKCLVWPGFDCATYEAAHDGFIQDHEFSEPRPLRYWMPLPEPPMTHAQYVNYETGTLMDVFTKVMMPFIGETIGDVSENILGALGVPKERLQDFNVTKVEDKGNGRIEYEVKVPYSLTQLSGTYVAEDDTNGNDS